MSVTKPIPVRETTHLNAKSRTFARVDQPLPVPPSDYLKLRVSTNGVETRIVDVETGKELRATCCEFKHDFRYSAGDPAELTLTILDFEIVAWEDKKNGDPQ